MYQTVDNLFEIPECRQAEQATILVSAPGVRIERIVSHGQASPPDFWYDQPFSEWVLLLAGAAALQFAGEAEPRRLKPGDAVLIPPHCRHRVEWTDETAPTIWLAVHFATPDAEPG